MYFFIMKNRPVLILSACLAGFKTRYDGATKKFYGNGSFTSGCCTVIVCPECSAGFGIPREPFHIDGNGRAVTNYTGRDLTAKLQEAVDRIIEELKTDPPEAALLKKRSPSCDPCCGVFATSLREAFPHIKIYTEESPEIKELPGFVPLTGK